jgi:hypothetical protein
MKKLGFLTLLITAILLLTVAFPVAATGPKTPVAPVAVPASASAPAAAQPPEGRHPRIHEALEAMRSARAQLQQAEGNYHNHREKAIEHLDAAIHEAEICEHQY